MPSERSRMRPIEDRTCRPALPRRICGVGSLGEYCLDQANGRARSLSGSREDAGPAPEASVALEPAPVSLVRAGVSS